MKTTDGKISFENIIITPLERWVNTDFDLDENAIQALNQLAEEANQSVDNVLNHILADFFAEHLELSQLNAETLLKTGEKCPCILLLENGKPIARVKMIVWGDGNLVFTSEKAPPKKCSEKDLSEPVINCDQFTWEAAKKSAFETENLKKNKKDEYA